MYNLIMNSDERDGLLGADRLLEGLDSALEDFIRPGGTVNTGRLLSLPTLCMPETGDISSSQVARLGNVVNLVRSGQDVSYRFIPSSFTPPIPSAFIVSLAGELGIGQRFGFSRTRWTVKDVDLYQVLLENNIIGGARPTAFLLPSILPEERMIGVMMPFRPEFDPVWATLQAAAQAGGWDCQRVDSIWEHSEVINDVVGLIARSKVVICDLTGRNANVFYEAGIAHTLGKDVILITQLADDVPFDLQHHRNIRYLNNAEGQTALEETLVGRLRTLMAR
jgi:hypothetical protein